ncbi:MAG: tetratricopeptide repeat protein, partial [Ktedonobacteraceae bacterium]
SYAASMMEHAQLTYKAIASQVGLAETVAGLGEIQRRRGFLERAMQSLQEGRKLAHDLNNQRVENIALLSMGDIYRQQGQIGRAKNAYADAKIYAEELSEPAGARGIAEAEVHLARLAIFAGEMKEAEEQLIAATNAMGKSFRAGQVAAFASIVQGQLLVTEGDFAQAEIHFRAAHEQAQVQQDPLLVAEAILGLGQAKLGREELEQAYEFFLEAGQLFQTIENIDGDGNALLGIAQVHLGQEAWHETIAKSGAAITRFNQCGDSIGQADALLTLGLAYRSTEDFEQALLNIEQALQLYEQQQQPLGIADTRSARAGIFLLRGDVEQARDEQAKAITQVERVMNSLSAPQQWSMFLRQYAELYAQTAITDIQRNQDEQTRISLQSIARITGPQALTRHLQAYIDAIPTSGEDLTEEERRSNTDLVRRIKHALKGF